MPDPFDPTPADDNLDLSLDRRGKNSNSRAALAMSSAEMADAVELDVIRCHDNGAGPGATCDEVELRHHWPHQSVSPAITKLLDEGRVWTKRVDGAEEKRPTRYKRRANVYRPVP